MPARQLIIVTGHVRSDPEYREFDNGGGVTKFSVPVTEKWKDKSGEKQEHTEWFNVVVWNKGKYLAAKYAYESLENGSMVYITGKLKSREYEGKRFTDLVADDVVPLTYKKREEEQAPVRADDGPADDDDLPF